MFSYYGSKSKVVNYYPAPKHDTIIEPFAGSARYSLKYYERNVILIDKSPKVVSIWNYLKECSDKDIAGLPNLPAGSRIEREMFDCQGQYDLMGFMIVQGAYGGNNIVSKFGSLRFKNNQDRVRKNLFKIKHWTFINGDYEDAPDVAATWFIDPPYQNGGHKYPMSNRKIDFTSLAQWIKTRQGQVIACENTSADWMDFMPMVKMTGMTKVTTEAIWSNEPTAYDMQQQSLF